MTGVACWGVSSILFVASSCWWLCLYACWRPCPYSVCRVFLSTALPLSCLSCLPVCDFVPFLFVGLLVGGFAPSTSVVSTCWWWCDYLAGAFAHILLVVSTCWWLCSYLACRVYFLVALPLSRFSCLLAGGSAPILGLGDVMTQSRPMKGRVKEI